MFLALLIAQGALAPPATMPTGPDPVQAAARYLRAVSESAFRDAEPCGGLLPALVGAALFSAAQEETALAVESRLVGSWRRVEFPMAAAALVHVTSQARAATRDDWREREELRLALLDQVLRAEVYSLGANRLRVDSKGRVTVDAEAARALRDTAADPLRLAAAAVAARSAERHGFETQRGAANIQAPWLLIAEWVAARQERSGAIPGPDANPQYRRVKMIFAGLF